MSTISTGHWTLSLTLAEGCTNELDGAASEITVKRDGGLDLVFDGWHVGHAELGLGAFRGVRVDVWVTSTGKVVTGETRWTSWEGETSRYAAAAHDGHAEAYDWLVDRTGGNLGGVSKQAWTQACSVVEQFAGRASERV